MSHFKLANTIDIDEEYAKQIIEDYFKVVPKVKEFLTGLGNLGKNRGYIRTGPPYRRVRFFQEWHEDLDDFKTLGQIERASMNTPIQGSNADLTKKALCNIYNYIQEHKLPVKIINVIHDEILTECDEGYAEEWRTIMSKLMTDTGAQFVKSVQMTTDCKIMTCWQK